MRYLMLLALVAPFMSGCVAWEIRDEMRLATVQLEDVKCSLEKVQGELGDVKTRLDTTNDRLTSVETGLQRLDSTNAALDIANSSLGTVYERLTLLRSIDTSLPARTASHVEPTSSSRNARAEPSAASALATSTCVMVDRSSRLDVNTGVFVAARSTRSGW